MWLMLCNVQTTIDDILFHFINIDLHLSKSHEAKILGFGCYVERTYSNVYRQDADIDSWCSIGSRGGVTWDEITLVCNLNMGPLSYDMDVRLKNPQAIKVVCAFRHGSKTYPRNGYTIADISVLCIYIIH